MEISRDNTQVVPEKSISFQMLYNLDKRKRIEYAPTVFQDLMVIA